MDLKGRLATGTLPGLLRALHVGSRTGVLHLVSAGARRAVHFREGELVHAGSSLPDEALGETLVREGVVGRSDLARAEELVRREGLRLDTALAELGAVERAPLAASTAAHARDLLLAAFASDGEYEFEARDDVGGEGAGQNLGVPTGEVVLDTVRRLIDPDVVRYGLGDLDRRLGPSADSPLRAGRITLTPTDGYVFSRVDGTLSAREILALTPLPPEDVLRSLLGLMATGLIDPVAPAAKAAPRGIPSEAVAAPRPSTSPPAPAPAAAQSETAERRREIVELHATLQARNHFEILGVSRDASEADVKAAYFRQAKRFHPDVQHHPELADLHDKLEAVFIRVGQAYEVLKNSQTRRSYEQRLPRETPPAAGQPVPPPATPSAPPVAPPPGAQVEQALRSAERHFAAQEYWDAIRVLEAALPKAEGRARTRARLLLAKALVKNPHWVRRAEDTLLAIVKDEPQHVEAHFLLGEIYKSGGLRARAAGMFRKVVELRPEHEEAAAQLAELAPDAEPPGEAEKPGFLKKLFGRQ